MSENHYTRQQNTALGLQDPRNTEAFALVEIARRMKQAQDEEYERKELMAVYQLNWKLWTIFQSELSNPDNALADEIKQNLLQLANFIDKHTMEQLREPTHQGLDVLININRQVGAGLTGNSGEEVTAATPPAAKADPVREAKVVPPKPAAGTTKTEEPEKKPMFRSKKVSK